MQPSTMDAIAVPAGGGSPAVTTMERPTPGPEEALVRVLRVGIDGTDHEILAGEHGAPPAGADRLVLGHEAVGVVEDANAPGLTPGTLVVPMVRRPPPSGSNQFFERGEPDMAPSGAYVERGIVGAHGYCSSYFTSPAEYLVELPESLAEYGFLVEPASITEKALEHALTTRSAFEWEPESALVLGNGSLGLLSTAMIAQRCDRVYCLGRRDRPDPTIDIIERLGATYIDSRETALGEIPSAHEPMDLVYEATGYAPHAFETIEALAPNGVGALVGVPGDHAFEIDGGALHRALVMENKALVGSVNSGRHHFERAIETQSSLPEWLFDALVTTVAPVESFADAFVDTDETIKTAIEFETP